MSEKLLRELEEHEALMNTVIEPKPLTPQEERRETIAAMAIGAFLGYLVCEVIFAGYR